jgi:hypothetical protein
MARRKSTIGQTTIYKPYAKKVYIIPQYITIYNTFMSVGAQNTEHHYDVVQYHHYDTI